MGWYYSLGIVFENENLLTDCKNKFPHILKLSNGNNVRIITEISNVEDSDNLVFQILPYGLSTDNLVNRNILFTRPYFYEIRNFLYTQLFDLKVNFKIALFDLEAGDLLMQNTVISDINEIGIDAFKFGYPNIFNIEGDVNASSLSGNHPPEYYIPKRYLDGLILHKKEFELIKDKSEFQLFKENYYWIPIKEFKLSN
ncbi:hypothetical protein [Chryseobacterium sp.]|uniref:hypothetical protein n=1 Tax=Chryseobacterium sp. TaxID=1871047 RepID=UPI0028A15B5D|nr:hypothetical protein [Chryseobacterium sp.]